MWQLIASRFWLAFGDLGPDKTALGPRLRNSCGQLFEVPHEYIFGVNLNNIAYIRVDAQCRKQAVPVRGEITFI